MPPHDLKYGEIRGGPISKWSQLQEVEKNYNRWDWIFRGHNDGNWLLQSSLERAFVRFATPQPSPNIKAIRAALKTKLRYESTSKSVLEAEGGLLRQFQRQCHHHSDQVPEEDDKLEWLALMQHHGAPTRLLDFTYSFYAAVFFAVYGAEQRKPGDTCCVWAISSDWLRNRFAAGNRNLSRIADKDRNFRHKASFDRVFGNRGVFVCPVNPRRLNDRQIIQQGVFLCPGDLSRPFQDNLAELQVDRVRGRTLQRRDAVKNVVKIEISSARDTRIDLVRNLIRMNMTPAALYPGLEGFARSLENTLVFPKLLESGQFYRK